MTGRDGKTTHAYRIRLLAGFLIVGILFAAAWGWSLYGPLADAVTQQQEEYLRGIAAAAAVAITSDPGDVQEQVRTLADGTDYRITIVGADGGVLADSDEDPAALENHGDRPEIRAAFDGRTGVSVRYSETQRVDRMYVAVPATLDSQPIAVRASTSLAHIRSIAERTRGAGLGLLVLALALSGLAAWRLSRIVARPVEDLADVARAMAAGDLSTPVPATDRSLTPLSDALTALAEQLRTRIEALDRERRTLRLVLDGLSDAVVLIEDDRVTFANSMFFTMFRLPPLDVSNRLLADLGLPASVLGVIKSQQTGASTSVTEIGPDPYQRSYRITTIVPGQSATASRQLVVIADITERTRVEQIRRDFVANASHELKTPTAGIALLASSANQAAGDGDMTQALAFISQIESEAARLRQLVTDLLDLSRLEGTQPDPSLTDVRRAIELAVAGHRREAQAKHLFLNLDLEAVDGQDIVVAADGTDCAIVLDNLLANAITYTERGGVTVRVTADDATVSIDVSDTGVGIPADDRERVFERFYRVDRARSRTSGGTGLGLSLVRNAVERAGGDVSLVSRPGHGTTVTVSLPRVR